DHGTQIIISKLRNQWKQGDIRRLWRNVKSISSPTRTPEKFSVSLSVPQNKKWLDGLLDTPDFLDRAMWHFVFSYEKGIFEWSYSFKPIPGIKLSPVTKTSEKNASIKLSTDDQKRFPIIDSSGVEVRRIIADEAF